MVSHISKIQKYTRSCVLLWRISGDHRQRFSVAFDGWSMYVRACKCICNIVGGQRPTCDRCLGFVWFIHVAMQSLTQKTCQDYVWYSWLSTASQTKNVSDVLDTWRMYAFASKCICSSVGAEISIHFYFSLWRNSNLFDATEHRCGRVCTGCWETDNINGRQSVIFTASLVYFAQMSQSEYMQNHPRKIFTFFANMYNGEAKQKVHRFDKF